MSVRNVVLVTYGEPPTPAFGAQLKYSWRILLGLTRSVAKIPPWVIPFIALRRGRLRNRMWRDERYGSPLERLTLAQADALHAALQREAPATEWRVHVAYEFRDPLLPARLDRLRGSGPVDVVAMYVADSAFTHVLTRSCVERWRASRGDAAEVRVLPAMNEEKLAELSARFVERELASRGIAGGPDWALVLAAHGTLLEPARPIETGRGATECVCSGIATRLAPRFGLVRNGWLNHVYGGRWTEPAMDEALREVATKGFRRAVYFPYGFLADNAESELEGRQALRAHPELEAVHLPCVNVAPEFVDALARQVIEFANGPAGAARSHPACA